MVETYEMLAFEVPNFPYFATLQTAYDYSTIKRQLMGSAPATAANLSIQDLQAATKAKPKNSSFSDYFSNFLVGLVADNFEHRNANEKTQKNKKQQWQGEWNIVRIFQIHAQQC